MSAVDTVDGYDYNINIRSGVPKRH